jgi:hypothetical protein
MQRDVAIPVKIRREDAPLTSMNPHSEIFGRGETKFEAHLELQLPCLQLLPILRNPAQLSPNRPGVLGWEARRTRGRERSQRKMSSFLLTENDESDEKKWAFDQQKAGGPRC